MTEPPSPQSDAEVAIAAAEAGAVVVRAGYGGDLTRHAKSSYDFATDVDIASEHAVMAVLRAARPQDRVVGEELGEDGPAGAARHWMVDPLCGTLNFAAQTPLLCVNVALRDGRGDVAAASADPFTGEVFWTDASSAYVRVEGRDRPLSPTSVSGLVDVNLDPAGPDTRGFRPTRLLESLASAASLQPRVLSTTLALLWVAAGRRAAYVTDGQVSESVHFAAGLAICRAAGCVVTDLVGGPVDSTLGGLVAAADLETHRALLALVQAQLDVDSTDVDAGAAGAR